MPTLDRRITVRRTSYTPNDFGESEKSTTDFPIWAGAADQSAFDTEEEGGTFTERLRKWMVRWRADLASVPVEELTVIDAGEDFNVTNLVRQRERGERRRFMTIEGIAIL